MVGAGIALGVGGSAVAAVIVQSATGDASIWAYAVPVGVAVGLAIGVGASARRADGPGDGPNGGSAGEERP